MSETMKLLGSTKSKTTKDKNGKNVPHLEIAEVVLVYWNVVNDDYQHDSRVLYTYIPNRWFKRYGDFKILNNGGVGGGG